MQRAWLNGVTVCQSVSPEKRVFVIIIIIIKQLHPVKKAQSRPRGGVGGFQAGAGAAGRRAAAR